MRARLFERGHGSKGEHSFVARSQDVRKRKGWDSKQVVQVFSFVNHAHAFSDFSKEPSMLAPFNLQTKAMALRRKKVRKGGLQGRNLAMSWRGRNDRTVAKKRSRHTSTRTFTQRSKLPRD